MSRAIAIVFAVLVLLSSDAHADGEAYADFSRNAVEQPIVLPDGRRFLEESLELIADSSGRDEITFGEWILSRTRAVLGYQGWELRPTLDLKLLYEPNDDAPGLWAASIEVDRVVSEHLKVGAMLFTSFPTEDYAQVGIFGGALWLSRIGPATRLGFRGGLTAFETDDDGGVTANAGLLWQRQLADGLALQVDADLRAPLGDGDALASVQVELGYWTEDRWVLFGGLYASEPQGMFFAGVGRLY